MNKSFLIKKFNKHKYIYISIISIIIITLLGFIIYFIYMKLTVKTIYIGCLFSSTGNNGVESYDNYLILKESLNYAAKRFNLNIKYEFIYKDLGDSPDNYYKWVEECVKKYNIKYFFGCWTSVQRKKVLPLLEKYNVRLFYSVSYEGLECTNNIYHFGALPNQSLRPCTLYIFSKYDYKDIYIIKQNILKQNIYSQIIESIIENNKDVYHKKLILNKSYNSGETKFTEFINTVLTNSPKGAIIVNLLDGQMYYDFIKEFWTAIMNVYHKLDKKYLTDPKLFLDYYNSVIEEEDKIYTQPHNKYPSISITVQENNIRKDYLKYNFHNYFCSNFTSEILENSIYQLTEGDENNNKDVEFLLKFKEKYNKPIGNSQYSTFTSALFFSKTLKELIKNNLDINNPDEYDNYKNQFIYSVAGKHDMIKNNHISKNFLINYIDQSGKFVIEYQNYKNIDPKPYFFLKDKFINCNIRSHKLFGSDNTTLTVNNDYLPQ